MRNGRGNFYPEKLSAKKMLPFYTERLSTVEINYAFYRMPTDSLLAGWSEVTLDHFRFTLKAPRRITHIARLRGREEMVSAFCGAAQTLGAQLGVLLFQLPPSFKKDLAVFDEFLGILPPGVRAAFEFRHVSWHDPDVFDRLRARRLALCVADSERMTTPTAVTAPYGYFRLRDQGYQPDDIARWAETIATASAARCLSTSSMKTRGRDPNSLACSWTHFPRRRAERCRPPAAHACPEPVTPLTDSALGRTRRFGVRPSTRRNRGRRPRSSRSVRRGASPAPRCAG